MFNRGLKYIITNWVIGMSLLTWLNVSDTSDMISYLLVAFILLLIALTFAYFISNHRDDLNVTLIHNQSNSIRVFVIDINKNEVRYFNQATLRNQRVMSVDDFYHQFYDTDSKKVQNWISAVLDPTAEAPHYLEADVLVNRDKKSYFSLLEIKKVDHVANIIHLESYILRYSQPKGRSGKKSRKAIVREDQIQLILTDAKNKQKGATYVVRFFPTKRKSSSSNEISTLFMTQLKEQVYPFLTGGSRYLIELAENDLAIVDTNASSSNACMQLGHSISRSITRYLDVNAFRDDFDYAIGIVENKYFPADFVKLYKNAKIMSLVAENRYVRVALYDKNVSLSEFKTDSFNEEIDVMIRDNKLNYLYRPILDVHNITNIGYFSYVKTLSSLFSSISEAKEYARQSTKSQDKELFDAIANKVVPDFIAQRDGTYLKLFFNVLMSESGFIVSSLDHISHIKEANLILTFDEDDVVAFTMENESTIPELQKFKDAGYEIALILANKDLLLASEIYGSFDYFIVDSRMTLDVNKNNRRRVFLHTLCDKLVHYKKPIIATDLENWNSVELMTKSGINLVSSNVISESDPMLLPFDRKKILKVKSFTAVNPQ